MDYFLYDRDPRHERVKKEPEFKPNINTDA